MQLVLKAENTVRRLTVEMNGFSCFKPLVSFLIQFLYFNKQTLLLTIEKPLPVMGRGFSVYIAGAEMQWNRD